jgi:hypothetical protein
METKEFDRWGKSRGKGMFKYILIDGVLAWGMPMFVVMTYLVPHPRLSVQQCAMLWPAMGAASSLATWLVQEHRYRKEAARRSSAPPPPAPLSENSIWKDH